MKKKYIMEIEKESYFNFMVEENDLVGKEGGFNKIMAVPIFNIIPAVIVIIFVPLYFIYFYIFRRRKIYIKEI